jgi:hypothetical protein
MISNHYLLVIPYLIIFGYTLLFHKQWMNDPVYCLNISKRSQIWWFIVMSVLCTSHWICFSQVSQSNIIKDENMFDMYKYLDFDYLKYKGIYTFVFMFVINSHIFWNVSWRNLSLTFALLILTLKLLVTFLNINNSYNTIDTVCFGASYYLFEPINMLVYSSINRNNWWNIVPINIGFKIPILYGFQFIPYQYSLFIFFPFWFVYVGISLLINEEFKELDI